MKTFKEDLAAIETNKFFHFVPVEQSKVDSLAISIPGLPAQYLEFLRTYGGAKLYRDEFDCYQVGVMFVDGHRLQGKDGMVEFGWLADGPVYFFKVEGGAVVPGIYGERGLSIRRTRHEDFDQWLEDLCLKSRKRFTRREWARILKGPRPFSAHERLIVEARRKFKIEKFDQREDIWIYTIRNESDMRLPYFSVGLRSKDHTCITREWINVSQIGLGEKGEVRKKPPVIGGLKSTDYELFDEPDPGPEDRSHYWEFKPLPKE